MTEQVPPLSDDESPGDQADQASRLQMQEEQEAIRAALAGHVHGTDALDDRAEVGEVLEGPEPLDGESADASDDPVYGGGMPVTDPDEAALAALDDESSAELASIGAPEDGAAVAVDEGGTVADDRPASGFEADGDPDFLVDDLASPDDETAAEDRDALIDVLDLGHDPDDPQNPDGYGVPPDPDGGTAVIDEAEVRDPVADSE